MKKNRVVRSLAVVAFLVLGSIVSAADPPKQWPLTRSERHYIEEIDAKRQRFNAECDAEIADVVSNARAIHGIPQGLRLQISKVTTDAPFGAWELVPEAPAAPVTTQNKG